MRTRGMPLAVCSALLLALALPNDLFPLGSPLFGVVCLAPLLVALYRSRSYGHAAWLGVLFGTCSSVLSNFWLLFFQSFSVWTLGGVTLAYLGYHALLAPILRYAAGVPRAWRPFAVAAVWAVYEYLKSSGYLGYPWGLVAYPVHAITPLVQFVEITGVWGLCLLMAMVNGVAAEWLEQLMLAARRVPARLWRGSAVVALLAAAALGYGAVALQREIPTAGNADLVLVQHNANPWLSGDDEGTLRTLEALTAEGIAAAPAAPDLVVWSETAVRYWMVAPQDPDTVALAPAGLPRLPVPLLTGVPWVVTLDPFAAMKRRDAGGTGRRGARPLRQAAPGAVRGERAVLGAAGHPPLLQSGDRAARRVGCPATKPPFSRCPCAVAAWCASRRRSVSRMRSRT